MGAGQSQPEEAFQALAKEKFQQDYVSFFVNRKEYNVKTNGCDPIFTPHYLLVDYLRDKLGLTGTKYMCREGGCGACMVQLKFTDPVNGNKIVRSANSCLLPVFACDGMEILTVEALGNRRIGYSKIQQQLTKFGGTQCGFCTPGFVMTMNSLVDSKPEFTTEDVEYVFDGNCCRCTGYRPIIEGFKSLAVNPSEELKSQCVDIEDLIKCPMKNSSPLMDDDDAAEKPEILHIARQLHLRDSVTGNQWFKVTNLKTLYDVLRQFTASGIPYRLVAGNTGAGVFKGDGPYEGFIEINNIPELHFTSLDKSRLVLGGGVTLTNAIEMFERASKIPGFVYAMEFYKHFRRVAALSVRNRGTLAGNLMMKHQHRGFISDVFVLFESVGDTLSIGSSTSFQREYTMTEFLELDMNGKIILSINLPAFNDSTYFYKCYKLGRRHQNAAAFVNAGFLFSIDPKTLIILTQPRICYGGINENFIHAEKTERFLFGRKINKSTLQSAMMYLSGEVAPEIVPQEGSPEYRRGLTQSFLYKFFLAVKGKNLESRLQSGAKEIPRGNSKGKQIFETDPTKWPLYQPLPKLESLAQVSGEAEYINDIRAELDELFGVFVVSTVANATLKSVDASKALMVPGVVAFITAKDIPGSNNFAPFYLEKEEIFAESKIRCAGQAIGLLVARDKYAAFTARPMIQVEYANIQKPILDIKEVTLNKDKGTPYEFRERSPDKSCLHMNCRGIDAQTAKIIIENMGKTLESGPKLSSNPEIQENMQKVKGEFRTHPQAHFHMESQVCICVPNEDGMEVYSATQHMNSVQVAVAGALKVPNNNITVHVRRLGGAFGAKISKATHVATACAVAAHVTNKPVRVAMDLETNMQMIGKRLPYLFKYEVDVDETGKIQRLDADIWCDNGSLANEPTSLYAMICFQSCYRGDSWNVRPKSVITDNPVNTYCRSPGSAQGVAAIEHIMEHIAHAVKKDPLEVRQMNMMKKGDAFIGVPGSKLPTENIVPEMIEELKQTGEYEKRKEFVEEFNKANRWKKRGISIIGQRYPNYYPDLKFPTFISVYAADGTVTVSHGGIEMGQGLNTKVAQVVAFALQIPIDKVKVKPSNTVVSPNAGVTGGSIGSELICSSARRACEELLKKLEPVRQQLHNPTWEQLISAANDREILLTSQFQEKDGDLVSYDVWGVMMIEVEVDVLTGDFQIVRADIINDCGHSLSPLVDIGQVEGGLVMGLGWWTTEELIYDQDTGQLLTDNTWHYKPMLHADIPTDLRVTLLRKHPNAFGVLSSKATGEPPFNMSCCVLFALRQAIDSARREVGNTNWYQMDGAVGREVVRRLCLTTPEQFSL